MIPYFLVNEQVKRNACAAIMAIEPSAENPKMVEIKEKIRNPDQNALMWVLLQCLERQTTWHGMKLSAEEYKDLLSAGLVKSKVVPNIDGTGFVILGQRTSKMTKRDFSDLIELIYAFGADRGVKFTEQEK